MSENLFCQGQKKLTPQYDDGWYRTYKTPPKMGAQIKRMLQDFIDKEEFNKVIIFFTGHCKLNYDYSCFLLRELIQGEL